MGSLKEFRFFPEVSIHFCRVQCSAKSALKVGGVSVYIFSKWVGLSSFH